MVSKKDYKSKGETFMATLVRVHGQGIDQLQLDEVELRELASNEVRMTVKASRITGDQLNYIKGLRLPEKLFM